MGREDGDVVLEAQHLVPQRRVRVVREPLLHRGPEEIYARDMSHQQRATAEEILRII